MTSMKNIEVRDTNKGGRNTSMDVLRGIAILCVVFTHLPGISIRYNLVCWWIYAFIVNMAVPVFMILMGYCACQSAEKKQLSFLDLYSFESIWNKIKRYFFPWLPIIAVEFLAEIIFLKNYNLKTLATFVISGGSGPGSYYIPILFQFVLLFPALYIFRKNILVVSFLLNLFFELAVLFFQIPQEIYRICFIRYIFLVGCCMNMYYRSWDHQSSKFVQIAVTLLGVLYIVFFTLFLDYGRTYPCWWSTGMFCGLYLYFPIYNIIKRDYFKKFTSIPWKVISNLGVASFHIYLVQMLYFAAWHLLTLTSIGKMNAAIITFLLAFPVCILTGWGYFGIEKWFYSKFSLFGKKKSI